MGESQKPKIWEVEQKFHVDNPLGLQGELENCGFTECRVEQHQDTYWRHPCRDFRQTDEALRIRVVNDEARLTYKGARLPGSVKTRPEIELGIAEPEQQHWREVLERLGFQPLPTIQKFRRIFATDASEWTGMLVALDSVQQLGEFVEIELLVNQSSELAAASARIERLGRRLQLTRVEPRSYLAQLAAKLGWE